MGNCCSNEISSIGQYEGAKLKSKRESSLKNMSGISSWYKLKDKKGDDSDSFNLKKKQLRNKEIIQNTSKILNTCKKNTL